MTPHIIVRSARGVPDLSNLTPAGAHREYLADALGLGCEPLGLQAFVEALEEGRELRLVGHTVAIGYRLRPIGE